MSKISSTPRDLLVEELKGLWNAEKQLLVHDLGRPV